MISVIIPSYHSQSTISNCVQSILDQEIREEFEIIIINSSQDETPSIIRSHFPSVHLVQLEKRVFAGRARNIGIQESKGDILAFLDSDCTASKDWLKCIFSWHKKGYKAVGGSIVNASEKNIFSKAEYPLEILEFSPNNTKREVTFVSAANCSFSREVFSKYGKFPDIRAGEDVIFSHILRDKGEKILFDPEIKVFHKNDISFRAYLKKQIMHGKNSFDIRQMRTISGSFLNNLFLFPLVLPFLPFIRVIRVILRSITLRSKLLTDILTTFPIFFLGCIMWGSGYAKGYFSHPARKRKVSD
jgi:glycosyltransferase involved in cell wall biosynthesis